MSCQAYPSPDGARGSYAAVVGAVSLPYLPTPGSTPQKVWCTATGEYVATSERCPMGVPKSLPSGSCPAEFEWCDKKQSCVLPWEDKCDSSCPPGQKECPNLECVDNSFGCMGPQSCPAGTGMQWCAHTQSCIRAQDCPSTPFVPSDSEPCIATATKWCGDEYGARGDLYKACVDGAQFLKHPLPVSAFTFPTIFAAGLSAKAIACPPKP